MNSDEILAHLYLLSEQLEVLTFLFDKVETCFEEEELETIDEMLSKFEPSKQYHARIAILRCTFRARHLLPNWVGCRDRVRTWMKENDGNWEREMHGLLGDE